MQSETKQVLVNPSGLLCIVVLTATKVFFASNRATFAISNVKLG